MSWSTAPARFARSYRVDASGCWLWLLAQHHSGYGRLKIDNYPVPAHRLSWLLHRGEIPEGLQVLHRCDERRCVNPEHLFLGTNADNIADRMAKDRPCGPGLARLPNAAVVRIRSEWRRSGLNYTDFAAAIGLHRTTVSRIARGERRASSEPQQKEV